MATTSALLGDLTSALVAAVGADAVDAGTRRRAEYSSDASNYRVVPQVVVFPRSVDDIEAVLAVCRVRASPLTVRGAGTSIAGNAVGPGVVVDLSRHLGRVLDVDPGAATATVEPGAILDDLQAAAAPHGLRFGPEPSTHARCTLGGMIGNNACGAHAMAWGTTAANVVALDVLDGRGRRWRAASGPGALDVVPGLSAFVDASVAPVEGELGRFGRQVSGFALQHLLGRQPDVARALVGTEGTCAVVLGATLSLVPLPGATALAVLGYADMPTAADAVPGVAEGAPLALEGIDARMVDVIRRHRSASAVPDLPRGAAWMMAEVGGATTAEALSRARALVAGADAIDSIVVPAGPQAARLWRIREDGAGLGSRTPAGEPAWPGWEDAAVPPAVLGAYLRDFERLLADHHLDGLLYGHFGDGCVHVRIDLPLAEHAERLRPFLTEAAALVASYGGSLSGEHGDGRARGELLPLMYSPAAIAAFAGFKSLLDPEGILNPGVVVDPAPIDADLRRPGAAPLRVLGGFALHADGGDLTAAAHRCVGLAKCRADTGGFMCPSFLATGDEKDSTRGRARVLQEAARGTLVGGLDAPEVAESLDLCLSCKACGRDCPAGVDVATYKSEVLHRRYRHRLRPPSHYALGWLPRWLRIAGRAPGLANAALRFPPAAALAKRAAGIDARRPLPALAPRRRDRPVTGRPGSSSRPPVVVWVDSFTRSYAPAVVDAACEVLSRSGFVPMVPDTDACCGLTWITTGQLDGARRRLRAALDVLGPWAEAGTPILGLEPSCTAALRADLPELLAGDRRSHVVAGAVRTLAELLTGPGADRTWLAGTLVGTDVVAQPHCHHHAVMGWDADRAVLAEAGASVTVLAGCCGLAGNFGMERGHYDLSVAVARRSLLPALDAAPAGAVLLADGFSCRTQADQLAGRTGLHLAQLLAGANRPR